MQVDPDSTAYVRYTPSENNPNAEFADEIYFPSNVEPSHDFERNSIERYDEEPIHGIIRGLQYPEIVKRTWLPAMHRRSLRYDYGNPLQFLPQDDFEPEPEPEPEEIDDDVDDIQKYLPFIEYLTELKLTPEEIDYLLQPENTNELQLILADFFETYEKEQIEREREEMWREWVREENLAFVKQKLLEELASEDLMTGTKFTRKYNTPERFRNGWESKDQLPLLDNTDATDLYEPRVYIDENDELHEEVGSGEATFRENHPPEIFRELKQRHELDANALPHSGIFTEGGLVYLPDPQNSEPQKQGPEMILNNDLGKFLDEFDWGFKRRERLDVKKPGPPFDEHIKPSTETNHAKVPKDKGFVSAVVKKEPRGAAGHPDPMHDHEVEQYDVQSDSVYIGLKDR